MVHFCFGRIRLTDTCESTFREGAGSYTFKVLFFELLVRSRSRFPNFSSALGPILKFLSILSHNFFICPL